MIGARWRRVAINGLRAITNAVNAGGIGAAAFIDHRNGRRVDGRADRRERIVPDVPLAGALVEKAALAVVPDVVRFGEGIAVRFPVIHPSVRDSMRIEPTAIRHGVVPRDKGRFLLCIDTAGRGIPIRDVEGVVFNKDIIGRAANLRGGSGKGLCVVVPEDFGDKIIVSRCHRVVVDHPIKIPCGVIAPERGQR